MAELVKEGAFVLVIGTNGRDTLGLAVVAARQGLTPVSLAPLLAVGAFTGPDGRVSQDDARVYEERLLEVVAKAGGELWACRSGEAWPEFTITRCRAFRAAGGAKVRGFAYFASQDAFAAIEPPPSLYLASEIN